MASADCLPFVFTRMAVREKGAKPMSDSHHLGFTPSFLEACADLKCRGTLRGRLLGGRSDIRAGILKPPAGRQRPLDLLEILRGHIRAPEVLFLD